MLTPVFVIAVRSRYLAKTPNYYNLSLVQYPIYFTGSFLIKYVRVSHSLSYYFTLDISG